MRSLLAILLTAALGFVAGLFLPWWSIAIVAFLVALLLALRPGRAFLCGFAGIFILWGVLSWWIDMKNSSILSRRMAEIFPLHGSSVLLVLITALVGGLVGGFAAMTGGALTGPRVVRRR